MPEAVATGWSLPRRIAFRASFVYFALYFFPLPYGLSGPPILSEAFEPIWKRVVPIVALRVFRATVLFEPTGSGDTTYDYVRVFCFAALTLLAVPIWSVLDRKRADYRTLGSWGRIWLRYALAIPMIGYGWAKP